MKKQISRKSLIGGSASRIAEQGSTSPDLRDPVDRV